MVQKPAILYVEKITCTHTTEEAGHDDVCLKITVDGKDSYYPSRNSTYTFYKSGGTQYVDLAINVTYANKVVFELIEIDLGSDPEDKKNERIGNYTLTRAAAAGSSSESHIIDMDAQNGQTEGEYTLTYRIISDPVPTLRVLGIRCEQQSAGMNVELVEAIADVAGDVTKKAGQVISKSPRPRAKAIGKAFKAASKVLEGVAEIGEWIGRIIEGKYDEVYMDHVESTRGLGGAFFPPDSDYEKMESGDDLYFEEKYGHYFRFPLDRGPVTLEFREHDGGKKDVNIGTLTVAPDSLSVGASAGVSGTTVNGGVAVMDGPAVVELANSYGGEGREGEGALYHICYSVGFEDWCLPATSDMQGGGVSPEYDKTYSIIARHSRKALSVNGASDENGANIDQWTFGGSSNQLFTLKYVQVFTMGFPQHYYMLIGKHSGKALTVNGSSYSYEDGANVNQWSDAQQDNQLFTLKDEGCGYYSIISKYSQKAITVNGASDEDGANVDQWNYNEGAKNQHFAFFPE